MMGIMDTWRQTCGAALAALTAVAFAATGDQARDEQLLQTAQVGPDGPALLDYFRQRTVGAADRKRIESLIRQLGDPAYAVRERAMADLVACGLPAIGPLRQAQNDPDVEVARRAERCLERIERVPSAALSAAAARSVARQKPAGAVAVMLAYLPVADDESVADEVRDTLAAVAVTDGRPDALLTRALDDPNPHLRGAAAEALARSGLPAAVEAGRKGLADASADVRLRTALALVTRTKDKSAVRPMIDLIAELPQGSAWQVEDVLIRLAGDAAPKVTLGEDAAARQKYRDVWQEWWQKNESGTDLAKLDAAPPMLGHTLLVVRDPRMPTGKVFEINAKKEVVWKIEGLQMPTDAVVIGRDHVLITEELGHQVSERDLTGKILWSKQVPQPIGVQRLPNGNTFVACRSQLVEYDSRRREVFSYQRQQFDICAARKLRGGDAILTTRTGQCVRVDAKGKEAAPVALQRGIMPYPGDLDVLPNNHILVTQQNGVAEYDPAGGPAVWQATFLRPTSVQRLPNGNTLVASGQASAMVAELDRAGKTVWKYDVTEGPVWRARRR
jgi:hypothetical protein